MKINEFYEKTGGNYSEVSQRFLYKEELVYRFLKKFADDPSFGRLEEAMKVGNTEEIFRASHTLKGVALNLGLKPLSDTTHVLVEITRVGKNEGIRQAFEEIKKAYYETIALIEIIE